MNATSLPHVVLVLTDQQSVWTLSSYHRALGTHHASYADFPSSSSAPLQTPSLDALAARGALFTNFVVASPACVPSRYSLLTSIDPLCCTCGACVGGCGDARPALCARRIRSATLTCERDAERRKCARSCGVCE